MKSLPDKPTGAIRQSHIAQMTGLSLSTISKALNGRDGVSKENREKVERAVNALGFHHWQTMPTRNQNLSAVTVIAYGQFVQGDAFYEKILHSIIDECQKYGISIDINLQMRKPGVAEIPEASLFQKGVPESVIMLGIDHPPVLNLISAAGCPAILVNGVDPMMRFDSVSPDYFLGGFLATQHLLDLGHREIVHVGTSRRITLDLRRQGFVFALEQAGIAYDPERHFVDVGLQEFAALDEQDLYNRLIKEGKSSATAFFAVADTVAMSVIQTLNNGGFSVPTDASVIGFDNMAIGEHYVPRLTSINSGRSVLGKIAVKMLAERISNPQKEVSRICVGVNLITRESTAPRDRQSHRQ